MLLWVNTVVKLKGSLPSILVTKNLEKLLLWIFRMGLGKDGELFIVFYYILFVCICYPCVYERFIAESYHISKH